MNSQWSPRQVEAIQQAARVCHVVSRYKAKTNYCNHLKALLYSHTTFHHMWEEIDQSHWKKKATITTRKVQHSTHQQHRGHEIHTSEPCCLWTSQTYKCALLVQILKKMINFKSMKVQFANNLSTCIICRGILERIKENTDFACRVQHWSKNSYISADANLAHFVPSYLPKHQINLWFKTVTLAQYKLVMFSLRKDFTQFPDS